MRLVLLLLLFTSCSSKINIGEIKKKNNLYYYNDELYSGKVYDLFEGTNSISYVAKIRKGIPNGLWISYGYDGEIVSKGSFTTLNTNNIGEDYLRITLEKVKEGNLEMNKIFVITNFPDMIKNNQLMLKEIKELIAERNLPRDTEIQFAEYEF